MHALNNIGFSNFKAFKDYQSAEISSISLFFGYNNSGKSSILRALKLLSDSFRVKDTNQYLDSILDYTSQSIRGASHQELTHINSSGIEFSLGWGDDTSVRFKVKQSGLDPEIIEELTVTLSGKTYHFLPSLKKEDSSEIFELEDSKDDVKLIIKHFRLDCEKIDFSFINKSLDAFSKSVFHLNSTRSFPPREFEIGVGIPLEISPDGIGTAEVIWNLAEVDSPSFRDINEWLKSISGRVISTNSAPISIRNGKRTVKLETISASTTSNSELSSVSVLDSGEGIAQVLPVITLCAQAANNELGDFPIVVLEQPELHLHPAAIVALAEFICRCAQKNKNARFIIETHSESFLLSIQNALVSQKLSSEDFSCNWVSKGSSSSSEILKVIFDDDGYIVENWPDDVFGEVFQQTRDLIDARDRDASKST